MKLLILTITLFVLGSAMPHHGMNGDREPEFVKNMSEEGKQKFQELMKDETKTKGQIETEINNIIANESDDVKKQFEEMKTKKEEMRTQLKTKFNDVLSKLSPDAQNVVSKIEAIHNDMNITHRQEIEQIKEAINTVTDATVKGELESLRDSMFKTRSLEDN